MTVDDHGTGTHDGDAAPIGPCDLARALQDALRTLEQTVKGLLKGSEIPPDTAIEIGDVGRFVACAHEEARQLAVLMTASPRSAAWNEDLRGAVSAVPSPQADRPAALPARLGAVVDTFLPLKIATYALILVMKGRVSKEALLHAEWVERWLLLSEASMTRAVAFLEARGAAEVAAAVEDSAELRGPEESRGPQHGTPSRRATRRRPTPGKRLL